MADDMTPLERLDAISREVEELATQVAVRAKAFGSESGAAPRISLVKQRLKVALDELAAYPASADQINDE